MTTVPNATNTTGTGANSTAKTPSSVNKDQQTFLRLLTTQLQNQDPTNPTDTNMVTQQIALLSQVEQQTKTNSMLEELVSLFGNGQASNAVSYIGRQVEAEGNQGQLKNGAASFVYTLPAGAATAEVTISDSKGTVVFDGSGTTIAGRNTVLWDGKNSFTEATMPNGAYTFAVKAKDANGKDLTATTMTTGIVVAVDTVDGVNSLSLGDISVPIESVKSVYNPGTNPGA